MELIGAKLPSINKAEDRELFKQAMKKIGLKTPPSGTVETWEDALKVSAARRACMLCLVYAAWHGRVVLFLPRWRPGRTR